MTNSSSICTSCGKDNRATASSTSGAPVFHPPQTTTPRPDNRPTSSTPGAVSPPLVRSAQPSSNAPSNASPSATAQSMPAQSTLSQAMPTQAAATRLGSRPGSPSAQSVEAKSTAPSPARSAPPTPSRSDSRSATPTLDAKPASSSPARPTPSMAAQPTASHPTAAQTATARFDSHLAVPTAEAKSTGLPPTGSTDKRSASSTGLATVPSAAALRSADKRSTASVLETKTASPPPTHSTDKRPAASPLETTSVYPPPVRPTQTAASLSKTAASRSTVDESTTRLPKVDNSENYMDMDDLSEDEIRPSKARFIPALILGSLLLVLIVATSVGLALFLHRDNGKTMDDKTSDSYVLQGSIGADSNYTTSSGKPSANDTISTTPVPSPTPSATPAPTPSGTPSGPASTTTDTNSGTTPSASDNPLSGTDAANSAPTATPTTPDLANEDVDMVANGAVPLTGKVKIAKDGSFFLDWGTAQSILLTKPDGTSVILDKVSSAYLNNSGVSQELWGLLPYEDSLRFVGTLRQENDRLYFDVTQMTDSNGGALSTEQQTPSTAATTPNTPTTPAPSPTTPNTPTTPSSSSTTPNTSTTPTIPGTGQTSAYILAESATRELTDEDVKDLTVQQVNYAKNEIYARHGRKFQSKELQEYFEKQSWYKGTIEPSDFRESLLSDTEKRNAEFLARKERKLEPSGYKLDAKKD